MIKGEMSGADELLDDLEKMLERVESAQDALDEHGGDEEKDLDEKMDAVRKDLGLRRDALRPHPTPLMDREDAEAAMEDERLVDLSVLEEDIADHIVEE